MTAYGKDRALLRNIPSFRQLSGRYGTNRTTRAPRGGPPYFIGAYKPPTIEPDTITIVPGGYEQTEVDDSGDSPVAVPVTLPFVKFVEHFDGSTDKSAICSAGPLRQYKDLRNPCNGCDIYWATLEPGADGKKKSTRMSRQTKFAFGIIDFSKYHKRVQMDSATNRPKINPKSNQPYFDWVKCEGVGCDMCRAKLETKFGHNPHWPMSWSFFETVREADRDLGRACRSCGHADTVLTDAWVCTGCGEAVIEMATTLLKIEDIAKITESYYTHTCGKTDFLQEYITCKVCPNAERMTIFDVEFKCKRVPTQGGQSNLVLNNWTRRRELEGPLAELAKPKDLLRIFTPTPNKTQLERFGPPPFAAPQGEPSPDQSREYGTQYR